VRTCAPSREHPGQTAGQGDTDLANLILLCYRHHWMLHVGGWQLTKVERGRVLAIPPSATHRSWTRAPAITAV
jgi:hypothetical protein